MLYRQVGKVLCEKKHTSALSLSYLGGLFIENHRLHLDGRAGSSTAWGGAFLGHDFYLLIGFSLGGLRRPHQTGRLTVASLCDGYTKSLN